MGRPPIAFAQQIKNGIIVFAGLSTIPLVATSKQNKRSFFYTGAAHDLFPGSSWIRELMEASRNGHGALAKDRFWIQRDSCKVTE